MTFGRGIEIRVAEEDGLTYEVDALVLKHAQALYGLDARVAYALALRSVQLPAPDADLVFTDPAGLGARAVVFIGVKSLGDFSYSDVRNFGSRALRAVESTLPHATEIALTLHGVGFGLDEVACFEAEIAGILDAVESSDLPRSLRRVTFLETDVGRAKRMRENLTTLLGPGSTVVFAGAHAGSDVDRQVRRLREVAREGAVQEHAFVAMPFDESFGDVFHFGLSSAVHACGLLCERVDEQAYTGDILERLKDQIRRARLVVADLTGSNPNVFLEVGYAWGSGVPTVLVCRKDAAKDLKFDVQGQRCLSYSSIRDLESKLTSELRSLLR